MPTKPALGATLNGGHALAANMVGCWLFNETSGSSAANLVGGGAATLSNCSFSPSGGNFTGPAVTFPASTVAAVQTGLTASTAAWTMLCWVNVSNVSNYSIVSLMTMTGGSPFALFDIVLSNGPNTFDGYIWGSGGGPSAANMSMTNKPYATWCQIALVRRGDGNNYELYFNGSSTNTTGSGSLSLSGTELYIGGRKSFTSQTYEGLIDHAILWERDLSGAEISSLYSDPFQFVSTSSAYTQSLTGSLAPSATRTLASAKPFAVTVSLSGACARAAAKPFAGTATPGGTLAKAAAKPLAGALTLSGVLAGLYFVALAFAGALAATGSRTLAAAKGLVGALTPAGTLTRLRTAVLALAGALTFSGTRTLAAAKGLAEALTPSGLWAAGGAATLVFVGALVLSGSRSLAVGMGLAGGVALAGVAGRAVGKGLAGALSAAGALLRFVGKVLAGFLTPAGRFSGPPAGDEQHPGWAGADPGKTWAGKSPGKKWQTPDPGRTWKGKGP